MPIEPAHMNYVRSFSNVYMDTNSSHTFEELNEKEYLYNTLTLCKKSMGVFFNELDFYIFSSHDNATPDSASLLSSNKILFYISDEAAHSPLYLSDKYLAIFKSYFGSYSQYETSNIYPFPLGYINGFKINNSIKIETREYELFFSGNMNFNRWKFYKEFSVLTYLPNYIYYKLMLNPKWKNKVISFIGTDLSSKSKRWFIKFTNGFKTGLDITTYSALMANSKIVLCPKGFVNTETFRLTEALSCGCVVISECLPDVPFYKDSPIIQVQNWREGVAITKELVKDQAKLMQLHKQSINWWNEKLSDEGVAKYVVNTLISSTNGKY